MSLVVSAPQSHNPLLPTAAMMEFTFISRSSASAKRHWDMRQLASSTRPSTLSGQMDRPCVMQPSQFCSASGSSVG